MTNKRAIEISKCYLQTMDSYQISHIEAIVDRDFIEFVLDLLREDNAKSSSL